jgi:carboxypeptidase family protein
MRFKNLQCFRSRVLALCARAKHRGLGVLRRSDRSEHPRREMAKRSLIALVAVALCSACGSVDPTSPSSTTFAIRGTVTDYQGAPLGGAVLEVMDGPNAGQKAVADAQGRYSFARLQAGEFTIQVTAVDHAPATKRVMLAADTSLEFQLRIAALAQFVVLGTLTIVNNPDGTFAARGQSVNTGEGCAAQVSGTANFRNVDGEIVTTLVWSLPPTTVIRPGEQVSYEFCCITPEQAAVIRKYDGELRAIAVHCS